MEKFSESDKQKIVDALKSRGATQPCPRCGNNNFVLLDGYFNQPLNTELSSIVIGGPTVPSVVVACSRCGFLSQHALGALGLLPERKEAQETTK